MSVKAEYPKDFSQPPPYEAIYKKSHILPDSPLAKILNQPVLHVRRKFEHTLLHHFKMFTITDKSGHELATIREKKANGEKEYRFRDTVGTLLLVVRRSSYLRIGETTVILPGGETIGKCTKKWQFLGRHYDLFFNGAKFGRIDGSGAYFPVTNKEQQIAAHIRRGYDGIWRQKAKAFPDYVVTLDAGVLKVEGKIASEGFSLEEKAIVLGNMLFIDDEYFTADGGATFHSTC